jgi:hypothetical protein
MKNVETKLAVLFLPMFYVLTGAYAQGTPGADACNNSATRRPATWNTAERDQTFSLQEN